MILDRLDSSKGASDHVLLIADRLDHRVGFQVAHTLVILLLVKILLMAFVVAVPHQEWI